MYFGILFQAHTCVNLIVVAEHLHSKETDDLVVKQHVCEYNAKTDEQRQEGCNEETTDVKNSLFGNFPMEISMR